MVKTGKLYVVSAPSGAGKSTLIKAVLQDARFKDLVYAVSHTSRDPREGERDGKDYFFVTREKFEEMVKHGDFLEYTETFGNYYGTSKKVVEERLRAGLDVITDIDVVGAKNIKKFFPDAVLIFIAPPTFEILRERLANRQTESKENFELRINQAKAELSEAYLYDFLIINDDLSSALNVLMDIIQRGVGPKVPDKEKLWADFFE
jgi:guanylate kinase